MADNALKVIQHFKQDSAILVTGGVHSEGMKEYFKSKGFSYYLITPNIKEIGDNKAYLAAMLEENKSVVTSHITNILMLQSRQKAIRESGNARYPDYRAAQIAFELKTNARISQLEEIDFALLRDQYHLEQIPRTTDFRFISRSEARSVKSKAISPEDARHASWQEKMAAVDLEAAPEVLKHYSIGTVKKIGPASFGLGEHGQKSVRLR